VDCLIVNEGGLHAEILAKLGEGSPLGLDLHAYQHLRQIKSLWPCMWSANMICTGGWTSNGVVGLNFMFYVVLRENIYYVFIFW
jgi:hypothetical protein